MHLSSPRFWRQSAQSACNQPVRNDLQDFRRPNSLRGSASLPSAWFRLFLLEARGSGRLTAISHLCVGPWLKQRVLKRGFQHSVWY